MTASPDQTGEPPRRRWATDNWTTPELIVRLDSAIDDDRALLLFEGLPRDIIEQAIAARADT